MSYWDGQSWQSFRPRSTLSFEEKFNCNPHYYGGRENNYITRFMELSKDWLYRPFIVFAQQSGFLREGLSWYHFEGENAGVLAFKAFHRSGVDEFYAYLVDKED